MTSYNHCEHCSATCASEHTIPCRDCEPGGKGTLERDPKGALIASFNTVLGAISKYGALIEARGVDPTPVVRMLEGFITALEPPKPQALRDLCWDRLPQNSGCTIAEVDLLLDVIREDMESMKVPIAQSSTWEAGYVDAKLDFAKRLVSE